MAPIAWVLVDAAACGLYLFLTWREAATTRRPWAVLMNALAAVIWGMAFSFAVAWAVTDLHGE